MHEGKELLMPRSVRLIGPPDHVSNVLLSAAARGDLIDSSTPRHLDDGRVELHVTMLLPAAEPEPTPRSVDLVPEPPAIPAAARAVNRQTIRRRIVLGLKVTAGLVLLAAVGIVGYGVYLVAVWVLAHLWLVLGGLVALLVVVGLMLGKSGGCAGIHCPGCGHR